MADIEKVIKELEERIKAAEECMGNPMFTPDAIRTIVALLKEQEAVKPYHVNTNHEQHWKCGNCNAVISLQDKYCSSCGKHILWDDSKGEEWDW